MKLKKKMVSSVKQIWKTYIWIPWLFLQNHKFKKEFKSQLKTLCLPQDNSQYLSFSEHISNNVFLCGKFFKQYVFF